MLLDVLDEALEARIVEEVGSEVGLYQFAHALMQETLSSELSANRTVRLHARIAEALEKFYGSAADEHAAELVVHLAEAEVLLGAEKVVHYSLAAGESSMVSYAYEDAIQHFARGLDLHTSRDAIGAQLNIGLARALMHTSSRIEMQAACSALTTAYDIYDEIGTDKQEMIRLFTQFPLMPVQGIIGMASLYQRALKLVEHDTPDYIDLLIGQGHWARYELYDDPLANQSAEEAVEWGTSHDDSLRTLRGLLISKQLFGLVDGDPSGITLVESLVDQVNDPTDKRFACEFLGKSWARNGNLVRAEHWLRRGLEVAIDSRNRWNLAASTGDLIQVLLIGGQISEAVVTADNGIKQSPEEGRVLQAALLAHALSGDVDITKELVTATTRSWPSGTPVQKIYGAWSSITASWELGVDLINQQALDITAEFDTTNPLIPARIRYLMRIWLGLAALIQNDENEVAIRYEQIRDERRVPEEIPSGSWPGAHFPALMAAYLGRYDEAEAHYGRALDRAAAYTSPTLRARIISDYATMLFERNAPGDREKAIEFQDEAIAIATDLGMKPLLERVLAQREILKA
jgi:tetratricopeptide (TPR) repeat protein